MTPAEMDRMPANPPENPDPAGLVLVAPVPGTCTDKDLERYFLLAKRFGPWLNQAEADKPRFFSAVLDMDGAFGFGGEKSRIPWPAAWPGW